jgi:hypothetical protein
MNILITKTPLFEGHRKLWEKYKNIPTPLFTILEDFGIDAALHCTPASYDNALLAFDLAERVLPLINDSAAHELLQLIESTANGYTTKQRLGKARARIASTGRATDAIIAASMIPPDLALVAELAATAKRHEAYTRAKALHVIGGAWVAGAWAYNEEREAQKEIFKAYFG